MIILIVAAIEFIVVQSYSPVPFLTFVNQSDDPKCIL